jgi:hypothetical protein
MTSSLEWNSQLLRGSRQGSNPFSAGATTIRKMLRRFTDHPTAVNETYLQHMAAAFGFGARMLGGALACFVHGLFPWLCLTRGSDTVRTLHHRMVTRRISRPSRAAASTIVQTAD